MSSPCPKRIGARRVAMWVSLSLTLCLFACQRGERATNNQPAAQRPAASAVTTELHAGGTLPPAEPPRDYDESTTVISEGKRLFSAYNCNGCHSEGGGGMGPALIDDQWIYGERPEQIFATLVQGRPNGMPSFRGKLQPQQMWQLAAYVRSLGGLAPKAE